MTSESAGLKASRCASSSRVLIVDDNHDVAEAMKLLLESYGHDVRTAADGAAGLTIAAEFQPAVVLLDLELPVLDGYHVAQRLRQMPWGKSALIVALSGYNGEAERRRAEKAGCDLHIVKPVDFASLETIVRRSSAAGAKSGKKSAK